MSKKKKQSKTLRRQQRLAKAKQWLIPYNGSPKKIVKNYRKKFHVDVICALKELQMLGVEFAQEYLDAIKHHEKLRLQQKAKEKQQKEEQAFINKYADSDDTFFYIAGYTSGGAPYGVTWEEMGLEPYEEIGHEQIDDSDTTDLFDD